MVQAYSDDLRQRCVDAMVSGEPASKIAKRFGVAKSSVIKWHQRYKATGSVSHNAVWLFLRSEGLSFKKKPVRN